MRIEKFSDIKVGDVVFISKNITYKWNSYESFFIPEKVVRITETQFVVESGYRFKKSGIFIGDGDGKAYKFGEKMGWGNKIVCDEREQMENFILKINTEHKFNQIAEKLKININSKFDISELNDLLNKIKDIENIINNKTK